MRGSWFAGPGSGLDHESRTLNHESWLPIPAGHHLHGRFAPRRVSAVLWPAIAIGPYFPPIHPLKPGLPIERLKHSLIAPSLLFGGQPARRFIPGLAMWILEAGETDFGEDHRSLVLAVNRFYFLGNERRVQIVGKRVV